ncbi:hypothetical protein M427DRAFT_386584 [Gonapodya prolifera JEL478]|uniref:Zn(2)-C6 fungal-type domain-containing protein n=1 Tax=Gonapodya prolifera (strain JEL478) TaxID=1344416 RepID=A0A139A7X6_GONPJ|nr:hypothetical protein M427DRAFT_386584 [Gonapodya prolifera JEL478]|eukprot:KXS12911.1 hypothetical protein M427DRAFT_386584 [Gonapodya prolifera JEL478]
MDTPRPTAEERDLSLPTRPTMKRRKTLTYSRKAQACDYCHQQKVMCLGQKPCGRCVADGLNCTFDRPSRKRGPVSLRARLDTLETIVTEAAVNHVPSLGHPSPPTMPVQSVNDGEPSRYMLAPAQTYLNGPWMQSLNTPHLNFVSPGAHVASDRDSTSHSAIMPPQAMLMELAIVFLLYFQDAFNIVLNRQRLTQLVNSCAASPKGSLPISIVPAVCAMGSFILKRLDSGELSRRGIQIGHDDLTCNLLNVATRCIAIETSAKQTFTIRNGGFERGGVEIDQLTVLAVCLISTLLGSSVRTFRIADMYWEIAVAQAKAIRLNCEMSDGARVGWTQREEARRIWWALFIDEAIVPTWHNKASTLSENDCKLHLPCPDQLYVDPIHPPPPPIPFKLAWSLLNPAVTQPPTSLSHASDAPTSFETLRSLFHSGRTGFAGYAIVLFAILHQINRYRLARISFPGGADTDVSEKRIRDMIGNKLDVWYAALPDSIVTVDKQVIDMERSVDGVRLEQASTLLFIFYYTYKVLLYGRWDVQSMVYDDEWLMSTDFLTCVESADRVTQLVELLVGNEPISPGVADKLHSANPYHICMALVMVSFVHAAVLRCVTRW